MFSYVVLRRSSPLLPLFSPPASSPALLTGHIFGQCPEKGQNRADLTIVIVCQALTYTVTDRPLKTGAFASCVFQPVTDN